MTRILLPLLLLATSRGLAGPDDAYRQAADALARGQGDAAAAIVDALHESGHVAPESFLLFGNARAAAGRIPEALVAYRRALLLDPALPEAKQNLAYLARQHGVAEAPSPGAFASMLARIPPAALALASVCAGWLGAILVVWQRCAAWLPRGPGAFRAMPVGVALLGVAVVGGGSWFLLQRHGDPAMTMRVLMADDPLLPVPARRAGDSPIVEKAKAGTLVRVVQDHGAWAYVEMPSGSGNATIRGWVRGASLVPLWNLDPGLLPDRLR